MVEVKGEFFSVYLDFQFGALDISLQKRQQSVRLITMRYYFPQQRLLLKLHIIKAAVRLSFYKGLGVI